MAERDEMADRLLRAGLVLRRDREDLGQHCLLLQEDDRDAFVAERSQRAPPRRVERAEAHDQPVRSTLAGEPERVGLRLARPGQGHREVPAGGVRGGGGSVDELDVQRLVQAHPVRVLEEDAERVCPLRAERPGGGVGAVPELSDRLLDPRARPGACLVAAVQVV